MGLLSALVFGLIAGLAAKLLMPGNDPGGCIGTTIVGVVGSVIGKWIGGYTGGGEFTSWSMTGFGMSVLGAMIFLLIYRAPGGAAVRGGGQREPDCGCVRFSPCNQMAVTTSVWIKE